MAWGVVDPADPVGGARPTSPDGDIIVTLDKTPPTELLTMSELEVLLGDRGAVAAWCSRQERSNCLPAGTRRRRDDQEKERWEVNFTPPPAYQQCRSF